MQLKSLFHIILTLFTLNAYSQQVTVLECRGKTEVAASSEKNFDKDAYSEIAETELLITINNDKLTVDNHEFEKVESKWEKDGDYVIRGYFIAKDQYYEGFYSLESNEPGDIEKNTEINLVNKYKSKLKSTVLISPHHGSKTSSSMTFLKKIKPHFVFISAGKDNRYKLPHSVITKRYSQLGINVLNTADSGLIKWNLTNDFQINKPSTYLK